MQRLLTGNNDLARKLQLQRGRQSHDILPLDRAHWMMPAKLLDDAQFT